MTAHPDGQGTSWDNCETIDIDQPHGKDYVSQVHLAKAVRKRINKEHEDFADGTVGGGHVAGWAKVLKRVDGTADVSGAVDATLFQGGGLVWSEAKDTLWCITADVTTIDPTVMTLHPDRQWKGGDVTWAGAHEFDASVDFTGPIWCDNSADFSDVQVSGDLSVAGIIKTATDISVTGDMAVDGTSNFTGDVALAADLSVTGYIKVDATTTEFGETAGIGLFYDPTVAGAVESVTLGNGIIIKMGTEAAIGAKTFDAAFPTACIAIVLTATGTLAYLYSHTVSKTGYTSGSNTATAYYWIAIGY